ncbi:hypothetical protein DCAR_0417284 [Daucus carota subsp. sativus]|uniref:Interferon-related developmental regulator N-terminal domain-containing protein n=1 Tax=Daucus carota subsp. sativus TaxID=79200 RepID=A0AAF0X013_DAUCS|nr:hypothetical protein DCAR_0417284 [Daucus carota subsp. sativus]
MLAFKSLMYQSFPWNIILMLCFCFAEILEMVPYLDNLFHKRGSVREKGLTTLITKLKSGIQLELVEENYFTILSRCENSIKKGSGLEIKLAAQVIGLIALTAGPGDCANEIYSESLRVLPQALETKSQPIPILECLAIVTFVRDGDFDETERSMKIIWEYINKVPEGVARVVVVAIYAWSFLLAKADHCKLDRNYWKGVIPYFLELLKNEDEYALYHPLIIEALALVSDKGVKHKFGNELCEALSRRRIQEAHCGRYHLLISNFLKSLVGKSGNSIMSKGRTQHRNKLRMISQVCSFYLLTRNLHPFLFVCS